MRSSRVALMVAGAILASSSNLAWANDKPADPLPSAPLLADPLLTNPLLVDGALQGHCSRGNCRTSLASIAGSGGEVPSVTTNVSPMSAAPDFFSDILAPNSSSGAGGGGAAGGNSGIGSIAKLSNGSLDTSKSGIAAISGSSGQGVGGDTAAQGSTSNPVRTASATVPSSVTSAGPLSQLVTNGQGAGVADPIVNFLGPTSSSNPNFNAAGDVIPVAFADPAPEPESFGLLAAGLVILGAVGWMARGRVGVPARS